MGSQLGPIHIPSWGGPTHASNLCPLSCRDRKSTGLKLSKKARRRHTDVRGPQALKGAPDSPCPPWVLSFPSPRLGLSAMTSRTRDGVWREWVPPPPATVPCSPVLPTLARWQMLQELLPWARGIQETSLGQRQAEEIPAFTSMLGFPSWILGGGGQRQGVQRLTDLCPFRTQARSASP